MGDDVKPCDEPCGKCGSADISRRFFAKGDAMKTNTYDKRPSKYAGGQCYSWLATKDHLHNHCRCCGYEWQRLPMAKRKAAPLPAQPSAEVG